ncbi:MAG: DUF4124 domain-containing protein [Deltaproteobacteria bacterium]|nr:MAG: DUF4124 domain-containing protein [Deltaproteobacteria bacterium]
MKGRALLLSLFFFLLIAGGEVCDAQIYKWVDDKGTVHFSDGPPSGVPKSQEKNQVKDQERKQVQNPENKQTKKQDKTGEQRRVKEDRLTILKNLEVGNRSIPDDMKKYGPAGGHESPRRDAEQSVSSPTVRRTSS